MPETDWQQTHDNKVLIIIVSSVDNDQHWLHKDSLAWYPTKKVEKVGGQHV